MDVSMKYRTQGSLPIGTQKYIEFIPRMPEPKQDDAAKLKQDPTPTHPQNGREERKSPPPVPPKPKERPVLPAAPPTLKKMKMPPFDPCKAIIETSPYYVYFKIITENDTKLPEDQNIREILHKMVVVDKDMPRTAKYRNFRSYIQ